MGERPWRLDVLYVGRLELESGGASRTCAELLVGLAGGGCRVRALSPITPERAGYPDPFNGAHPGLRVTRFPLPYLEPDAFEPAPDEYRALQREGIRRLLPQMIGDRRPDIILVGRESDIWSVPDVARAHGLPSVGIAHGIVLAVLEGWFRASLGQALLAEYRGLDLIIACAEHMAARLRARGFERVTAIPNAIDLDRFRPTPRREALLRRLEILPGDIVVLHVSNLRPVKRPLDLVVASAKALASDPRLVYVVVGGGESARAAMEDACRTLGVHGRFRFVGPVNYREVPEFMHLADLIVMPSESEGRARVYLEAQACGRLLLASDIPAAQEVIVPGETGLLFRKGDADDLAAKILLAARDRRLRQRIGRAAHVQARTSYGLVGAVSAYAETLDAVVRRFPARAAEATQQARRALVDQAAGGPG